LERDQEHDIRQVLSDLLISSTEGVCDLTELEILIRREEPQVRRKQGNELLHDYVRAQPESSLHDYVLLTFMSGRKPDRLAVDIPADVLDRLRPQSDSEWFIYLLDAVLLAEAFFILLIATLSLLTMAIFVAIFCLLAVSCNVIMVFQLHEWSIGDIAQAWRSTMSSLTAKKSGDKPGVPSNYS
jgi:hypothetical protein